MQTIDNIVYDPLDKEIDFSHVKIEKNPYHFDMSEKINLWIDTLYADSNLSKDSFYNQVENSLRKFCEMK